MIKVEIHIVRDEKIELPVIIVVQECRSSGPARIANICLCRHIRKRAVSIVPEKVVWTETGHVQVIETVVIVVARRDTHAKSNIPKARLVCYVRKRAIAVVSINRAPGFLS